MRSSTLRFGWALATTLVCSAAWAGPVPVALSINAKVAFDLVNSSTPVNASQAGTLTSRNGGADSTAGFAGAPSGGPLTGALTQTGDGIGVHFQASGSSANGDSTAGYLFADYTFDLANSSATETFTLVFKALYGGAGNKTNATGVDAFAESLFSVFDTASNEVIYSDFFSDTVNPGNNKSAASGSDEYTLSLAPGQSASFTAFQKMRGGAFDRGAFDVDLDAFLRLESIQSDRVPPPNDVPTPASLPLTLTALGLLALARRRQH